ncbi:MAG TPA: ABC transporter substrate-binding protein, partial [Candidatus Avipropionibacterium avicola]|nr:ABC transporter substrate-binding protein [Candidatus Avipropionibacterium avicola]
DESGALRFWPTSDQYRELMEFIQRLYGKGLIQQDIFTSDTGKFNNLGGQGILGAVGTQSPTAYFGAEYGDRYVSLPPLKKKAADPIPSWNSASSALQSIGQFVITDKSEHPIETARWMDFHYGDEGARLFFMGIEGETYRRTDDGEYEFLPEITDNPDGLTLDEALRPYVTYLGGGYAGIVTEDYFKAFNEQSLEGVKAVAPHKLEEVWPVFTYTSDEAAELSGLSTDITKLFGESQASFVTGKMTGDDWSTMLEQYDTIGLSRFMEIQQAAYDRYRS